MGNRRGLSVLAFAGWGLHGCEWAPSLCVVATPANSFDISAGRRCDDKSGTRTLRIDDADVANSPRTLWQISHISVDDAPTNHFEYGVLPSGYMVDVPATPLLGVCRVRVYSDWSSTTVPATVVGGAPCGR